MNKMTIEEIKELLWVTQIRNIISDLLPNYADGSLRVSKCNHWIHGVSISEVWRKTGWSRSTFHRRWNDLVISGDVTNVNGWENRRGSYDERYHNLIKMRAIQLLEDMGVNQTEYKHGLNRTNVIEEVLHALTHMGH